MYGKEQYGDLWEGKHTLILIHAMRSASDSERAQAAAILAKARPVAGGGGDDTCRTASDVAFLKELIDRYGGAAYASAASRRRAARAAAIFSRIADRMPASTHVAFLGDLADFVIRRTH
jgi:geranylgeranyl diphosphate synthase type II